MSCEEFGQSPEPTLDFSSMETTQDGYPTIYYTPIKASVFLPWLQQLPVDEQYKLLERVAAAKPDKQRAVLERERNSWIDE